MLTFKEFLAERALTSLKEVDFPRVPKIGWWQDQDSLYLYHGTHERNLPSVEEDGLSRKDPNTGMISLALEPHTGHGYAAMSGHGGEHKWGEHVRGKSGKEVQSTPHNQRVTLIYKIPMSWILQHHDKQWGGNTEAMKDRLKNKATYEKWVAQKGENADAEYYAICELRFPLTIPNKFLVGYARKVKSP